MSSVDELLSEIEFWLNYHKDVNVFYIRQRAKLENWSSAQVKEVVKYV